MQRFLVAMLLGALLLTSCSGSKADVSATAARQLDPKIAEVRAAAGAGQTDEAKAKLAELRSLVTELEDKGELDSPGARRVLDAAAGVEQQLDVFTTTTASTTSTTTTTAPDEDSDETTTVETRKSRGKGKGNDD